MKNFVVLYFILCFLPLTSMGQQASVPVAVEKIRVQGYLIIEGHNETIRKGSDIPRKFLFIPLEKFKDESFFSVYQKECQSVHRDLFIPTSFMEKFKLTGLNSFLRRSLNSPLRLEWEDSVNETFEDYLGQKSVFFKVEDANRELNITFIDGVWGKFSVPAKYFYTSYIEGYNMGRLKQLNKDEFYEYYYLLETMSFSPVIFINDDSLFKEVDH